MTSGMTKLEFPTKHDFTRRRQKIDILIKRAIKGNSIAKRKLLAEHGIKIYSSSEIEQYEGRGGGEKMRKLHLVKTNSGSKKQIAKTR